MTSAKYIAKQIKHLPIQTLRSGPAGRDPIAKEVIMKSLARSLILSAALSLSGCALFGPPPAVGDTESQVIAKLGQPRAVYPDGNSKLLSYSPGYFGQYSYMARIGPDGRLLSYEQVWTMEKFGTIKPDLSTKDDVLRTVGTPTEIVGYARSPYAAWNYGFKEAGVWNSMMTIYIDSNGIVRKLENGMDMRYERNGFFGR
jgi:hypothetical protein